MRAADNSGTYGRNLPVAVSNNWLPRQVHIPPIMCITAPCAAMPGTPDGRGGIGWTIRFPSSLPPSLPPPQIYLSPPCLPGRSFNERVIDALRLGTLSCTGVSASLCLSLSLARVFCMPFANLVESLSERVADIDKIGWLAKLLLNLSGVHADTNGRNVSLHEVRTSGRLSRVQFPSRRGRTCFARRNST